MKILVACEESQAVTIELRRLGHEAYDESPRFRISWPGAYFLCNLWAGIHGGGQHDAAGE